MKDKNNEVVEVGILDFSKFDYAIETYLHCLRRYQFASTFVCGGDNVLDICCGSGYGTKVLRQKTDKVTGLDRHGEMIGFAKKKYPDCTFILEDILTFDFNKERYDIITMFECIDHLEKENSQFLLGKAASACNHMLFLSVPCNHKIDINPYHLSTWTDKELETEMRKYFPIVVFYGQSWVTGLIYFPYEERRSMTVVLGIK